ncbi:MAG: hypothetical protein QM564_06785 [Bergeyella sp.]
MKQKENAEDNLKKALSQLDLLFSDPVELRKKSKYEIRQLLIMVWFA